MIRQVLEHYFPGWEAPEDGGLDWHPCECPVHDDEHASAGVSYEREAFNCFGCGFSGDVYSIIQQQEGGISFGEAVKLAERISGEVSKPLQKPASRKSRRGVSKPARFGSI